MKAGEDETGIIAIVAKNVRNARKAMGLSQEALADAAGVDRTYVSQVERRQRNLTIIVLARLAAALETTPDRLLIGDTSPETRLSPLRVRSASRKK